MKNSEEFPKVRVKRAYANDGPEAAKSLAKELSVPDSKINRWLIEWSTGVVKRTEKAKTEKKKPKGRQLAGTTVRIVKGSGLGKRYFGTEATIIERRPGDIAWPYVVRLHDGIETHLDEWEFEAI
jgi:hypothetical protein